MLLMLVLQSNVLHKVRLEGSPKEAFVTPPPGCVIVTVVGVVLSKETSLRHGLLSTGSRFIIVDGLLSTGSKFKVTHLLTSGELIADHTVLFPKFLLEHVPASSEIKLEFNSSLVEFPVSF